MRRVQVSLLIVACLVLIGCNQQPPAPSSINNPKDPNTTWRTTKALSYQQAVANGHCPISLPQEARQIQFVDYYAGFGGFAQYGRFEAPVDICRKHAVLVLKEHNSRMATTPSLRVEIRPYPLDAQHAESVAASARSGEPASQAPWFDTDAIKNGETWGDGRSHTPEVFIDLDKGVFYYRCTD